MCIMYYNYLSCMIIIANTCGFPCDQGFNYFEGVDTHPPWKESADKLCTLTHSLFFHLPLVQEGRARAYEWNTLRLLLLANRVKFNDF